MSDDILQQQIAYYRARAAEYDEWFYRKNRYDKGAEINQQWFDEAEVVRQTLHRLGHVGDALELACGTGIWTQELAKLANHVTALDASEEMLAINRAKLNAPNVTYQRVDLFAWQPERQYDLVFFGFWLSHVPPERPERWQRVHHHQNLLPAGEADCRAECNRVPRRRAHNRSLFHLRQRGEGA
jgi:demethylmenaquinone methyltransferase/2-methoxy-6-polyprenyl-1,4-benzoquinol methylase